MTATSNRPSRALRKGRPLDEANEPPVDSLDAEREDRDELRLALIILLGTVSLLIAIGVFMVFSATSVTSVRAQAAGANVGLFSVAIKHTAFTVLALVLGFILSNARMRWYQKTADVIFGLGLALQVVTYFIGVDVGGNKNWLAIPGAGRIQPAEFLKLALIIFLAAQFAKLSVRDLDDWTRLVKPIGGVFAAIVVVVMCGDMGSALIFLLIGVVVLIIGGVKFKYFLYSIPVVAIGMAVVLVSNPSRITRVKDFASSVFTIPDIVGLTQADFAKLAFGSGGLSGVGAGASKEKWRDLSEAHTDFIYAIIGEEWGFLGSMVVLGLFLALGVALYKIATHHPSRFGQVLAIGALAWIVGQALANMAVVTGLLPVFGVPLPFISQGGSSMMSAVMLIGVVISTLRAVPGVVSNGGISSRLISKTRTTLRSNR